MAHALAQLGPIFAAFGRYLSTRVDLLPLQSCMALGSIPDCGEATPRAVVRDLVAKVLPHPQTPGFAYFEEEPIASRLLVQQHRAILQDGTAVQVTLVHPAVCQQIEGEMEHLQALRPVLAFRDHVDQPFEAVIKDFQRWLAWHTHLGDMATSLDELTQGLQSGGKLSVPTVHRHLCSPHMLTLTDVPGPTLAAILALFNQPDPTSHARANTLLHTCGMRPHDLADLLCRVWWHQVLLGQLCPTALCLDDIVILPDQRLALTSGRFIKLTTDAKQNLWTYMMAVSADEPDSACTAILKETIANASLDIDELRDRFREVVPFRDSEWPHSSDENLLIEYLLVHWRLLAERSLRLSPDALGFYQGLFQMATAIQRLPVNSDPFRNGLRDVQTFSLVSQFHDMIQLDQFQDNLGQYADVMLTLPQKLYRLLKYVEADQSSLKQQTYLNQYRQCEKNKSSAFISLLFLLISVTVLSRVFTTHHIMEDWLDTASTVVFIILAALLFRVSSLRH